MLTLWVWTAFLAAQTQAPDPAAKQDRPEPVRTSITVVEKVAAEAPASVEVLQRDDVAAIPGVNLDDRLRMVPGFSLFRRTSSLVAHPTTQGISLRGIGSTGASRSLVLWDGIPLNDAFGGWVYWTRVSPDEISRAEVSRGASTSVFGDRAMGGAIALFSREPEPRRVTGSYEAGNRNTHTASAGFSHLGNRFALSGHGRAFTTDGYLTVREANRGRVDREAGVRFVAGDIRFEVLGARQRLFVRTDVLVEDRENGTVLQKNSTSMGNAGVNYVREFGRDSISAVAYHTRAEFRSAFSAIAADRNSERYTFLQSVPATGTGGAVFWRHGASRWNALVGTDIQRVEGESIDSIFPTGKRIGGGELTQHGQFVQTDFKAGPARFFLGARHHVPAQDRQFFSPSAGVTAGRGSWRVRASGYRSFRSPTLNELYREFRAGNAVTQANALLKPERIFGVEAGADYVGENSRVSLTVFRNSLKDLIANVTLSSTPAQIIRQRRNSAEALAKGAEFDFKQRWRSLQAEAAYMFVDSRFGAALRTPQVARHQGSAQIGWSNARTYAAVGVRSYSLQYDDDLNRLILPGFAAAHFSIRRELRRSLSATMVMENMLNREFLVGFTPIPAIGAPRLWRAGLRWDGRLW